MKRKGSSCERTPLRWRGGGVRPRVLAPAQLLASDVWPLNFFGPPLLSVKLEALKWEIDEGRGGRGE